MIRPLNRIATASFWPKWIRCVSFLNDSRFGKCDAVLLAHHSWILFPSEIFLSLSLFSVPLRSNPVGRKRICTKLPEIPRNEITRQTSVVYQYLLFITLKRPSQRSLCLSFTRRTTAHSFQTYQAWPMRFSTILNLFLCSHGDLAIKSRICERC